MTLRAAIASAVLLVGLAFACTKNVQQGGLELLIGSDLPAGAIDSVEVTVSQQVDGGFQSAAVASLDLSSGKVTLPTTYAIIAGTSSDQTVLIRVAGRKLSLPYVVFEAQLSVPTDRVAELPVILSSACYGATKVDPLSGDVSCAVGFSCEPLVGTCVPYTIDAGALPDYSGAEVDAGKTIAVPDAGTDAAPPPAGGNP